MNALPESLRCVCASGHITLYPAAERGHIPADCPDCGGHIVHLADAGYWPKAPSSATNAPSKAAKEPSCEQSALEAVDAPTRQEWLARVKATEASIAHAAVMARERKRVERRGTILGWAITVAIILAIALAAGIAGGLD